MRKASTVMPKSAKIVSPKNKSTMLMITMPIVERTASARRTASLSYSVIARKTAMTKKGVRMKKNLTYTAKNSARVMGQKPNGRNFVAVVSQL